MLVVVLSLTSSVAFYSYGVHTLFAAQPREEFARYGLPHLRELTGWLQLLGATGVLIGVAFPPIGVAAATGLMLMMLSGLVVRIRLRDAPREMVPAGALALLNGVLVAALLTQ